MQGGWKHFLAPESVYSLSFVFDVQCNAVLFAEIFISWVFVGFFGSVLGQFPQDVVQFCHINITKLFQRSFYSYVL
jgi:hypothetical protein